jgi:Mg-chelatase subunit ChlD
LPWLAGLMLGLLASVALAGEPASLQVTQALAQGTEITAYVAVRDEAGAPVTVEAMGRAHATLGTQVAEVVSAKPFAATGEGVLYLFLVDVSRSLDTAQFDRLRKALREWVAALGEKDRAAILSFGTQVHTLVAPTADKAALTTAIDGLRTTDNRTALYQALAQGLTLGLQRGTDLPSRRALVILSDGQDDAPGGMTAEEVEQRLAEGAVPIYAIGFSRTRDRRVREAGLTALGRFARRSGGLFIDASAGDPGAAYAGMRERIRAVERLQLRCATCTADGNRYRLQIALPQGGRTLSDGVDVWLYPATPTAAEPPTSLLQRLAVWWPWLLGAGMLVLILLIVVFGRRRSPAAPEPIVSDPIVPSPVVEPPTITPASATVRHAPVAPRGTAAVLAFKFGARRGQSVRLGLAPEGLIGRTNACDLALEGDDEVSSRHARLFIQDRRLLVEDLGSTNGTWLNGVRVLAPTPLREGDVLRCGQTELRLTGIENGTGDA